VGRKIGTDRRKSGRLYGRKEEGEKPGVKGRC